MKHGSISRRDFFACGAAAAAGVAIRSTYADTNELTDLSILEASDLIRSKALSPVELVRAYLDRIEEFNPVLNAYITVIGDRAIETARRCENEIAGGKWLGPLHGIPLALKDNIDTADVLTTAGSELFADRVPTTSAEVARRLSDAGAVLLGKLNMHEFAFGDTSSISYFGPVRNPWNLDHVPGGSSGGSAAAVAGRLCAGALGTDTGGSIRQPAAYCGIVGLKPTYGLVSIRGIIPLAATQDHVGPMCRTVADAAAMLQVLAGYDAEDLASIETRIPDYQRALSIDTRSMKLGIPREFYFEDLHDDIAAATEEAIVKLRSLTADVVDVGPLPQTAHRVVFAEAYEYHAEYLADETLRGKYQPPVLERLTAGSEVSTDIYIKARREQTRVRREIRAVFEDVNVLITPTTSILPVTVEEGMNPSTPLSLSLRNTAPFDAYGIPTITVPCGFSLNGLPIGLQLSSTHLGEPQLFALAEAFERATDWHTKAPSLT